MDLGVFRIRNKLLTARQLSKLGASILGVEGRNPKILGRGVVGSQRVQGGRGWSRNIIITYFAQVCWKMVFFTKTRQECCFRRKFLGRSEFFLVKVGIIY